MRELLTDFLMVWLATGLPIMICLFGTITVCALIAEAFDL